MNIEQARAKYLQNSGVSAVEAPQVGQKVIWLELHPENGGYFIPCMGQVIKVGPQQARVCFPNGSGARQLDRRLLFLDQASRWCAGAPDDPYATVTYNGSPRIWQGDIYLHRQHFVRDYPEVDYENGSLDPAVVLKDWLNAPHTFSAAAPGQ